MLKESLKVDDANQFFVLAASINRPVRVVGRCCRCARWNLDRPVPSASTLQNDRRGDGHAGAAVGLVAFRNATGKSMSPEWRRIRDRCGGWQLDFAVDHARTVTTFSLSAIVRF